MHLTAYSEGIIWNCTFFAILFKGEVTPEPELEFECDSSP